MKLPLANVAATAFVFLLAGCDSASDADRAAQEAQIRQSQALVKQFQAALKAELSGAIKQSGPVGAIGVCQSAAPAIAADLSASSGAKISRISHKNRNNGNGIRPDLQEPYEDLQDRPMEDGKPRALHRKTGNGSIYISAIPMQEKPCTVCHGTDIAPEIKAAIDAAYPDDRATGFAPGELRGAFLVEWDAS